MEWRIQWRNGYRSLYRLMNRMKKLIRLLQTLQESGIERIVVVDDGSGNEYRNLFEQAKQLGAIVLTHAVNLGKGRALKTALMKF